MVGGELPQVGVVVGGELPQVGVVVGGELPQVGPRSWWAGSCSRWGRRVYYYRWGRRGCCRRWWAVRESSPIGDCRVQGRGRRERVVYLFGRCFSEHFDEKSNHIDQRMWSVVSFAECRPNEAAVEHVARSCTVWDEVDHGMVLLVPCSAGKKEDVRPYEIPRTSCPRSGFPAGL